ncbi:MAG TPA: YceI family protein [Egibacteraceae bacterium]
MTATATASTVSAPPLPAPGRWAIDPGHAQVGFLGRHFQLTKIRGRFRDVSGVITVADDPLDSEVAVTIGMASVESGNATRDEHLRSADLFDVERFPTATFRGRLAAWSGTRGQLVGALTLRDVTRQIALDVTYHGAVRDPWGAERIVFSASAPINREDWGVTWNMVLDAGGLLVSKDIQLEIEVEAIRED